MQPIEETDFSNQPELDAQLLARDKPLVLRSLVSNWPAVTEAGKSNDAICSYLANHDSGMPIYTIAAPVEAGGRFFYSDDLRGLNFKRGQIPLKQVLAQLLQQASGAAADAHSIAAQSLPVREVLPAFDAAHPMPLVGPEVAPTMWIGNRGKVAPHYDVHRNIACVVAGQRRFTLFPPDKSANLYPGPVLGAPGGVPISLVDIWNPDLDKYPLYADAQDAALSATLQPGDAIYIPALWWHAVESMQPINVLVNYWWGGGGRYDLSPNDSLLHAMMTIATLDDDQRRAWQQYFDYFVFQTDADPKAHLPADLADIMTSLSREQVASLRQMLAEKLLRKD